MAYINGMTTDLYAQHNDQSSTQNQEQPPGFAIEKNQTLNAYPSSGEAIENDPSKTTPTTAAANTKIIIMNNAELLEFQEKVFSMISENNGKLIFTDLFAMVGGAPYRQVLYKVLMNLAKQQRIARIRGIGKKRIEFYYYDSKKLKRPPPSASVSYIQV